MRGFERIDCTKQPFAQLRNIATLFGTGADDGIVSLPAQHFFQQGAGPVADDAPNKKSQHPQQHDADDQEQTYIPGLKSDERADEPDQGDQDQESQCRR